MPLVKQKERKDCVVAALSMATGISYAKIRSRFFPGQDFSEKGEGVSGEKQAAVMRALGYKLRTAKGIKDGVPGIVTVKSLNIPNSWHAIYFTGKKFLDPNRGREGKRFYLDVGPEAIIRVMCYKKRAPKSRFTNPARR